MSGVVIDGVQWEHCCKCSKWVRLENLGYLPPVKAYPSGLDLCIVCANALPQRLLRKVKPAPNWQAQHT